MGAEAVIFYLLTFLFFLIYFGIKLVKRKYIFSIFNISFLIYCFSVFITPIYYAKQEAWAMLDVTDHVSYYPYLDKCLIINCIGLMLTFSSMFVFEFNRSKRVCVAIEKWSEKFHDCPFEYTFWFFAALWYLVVFIYNGNLPLLNNGRTFYYNTAISPVYLALNELMLIYSLYFGTRLIYGKKDFLKFLIAVLTLIFTGNRGPILIAVVVPIAILFIYGSGKAGSANGVEIKKLAQLFLLFIAVGLFGLMLSSLRSGQGVNLKGILQEILYGNTFSDIRDGAFILRGFEKKFGNNYWFGKTYLAGFISFIPSQFSSFRVEWSYGRVTTYALFGWENHFGLRGGAVMEAYLNFGWFGIIISGILQGVFYAQLEKIFYYLFYLKQLKNNGKELLCAYVLNSVNGCFICTAGMYNIYVDLLFLLIIAILSSLFHRRPITQMKLSS